MGDDRSDRDNGEYGLGRGKQGSAGSVPNAAAVAEWGGDVSKCA